MRHMNISAPLASGGTEVTYGIKTLGATPTQAAIRHTHPIRHTQPSPGTGLWRSGRIAARAERITRGTASTPPEHR